jgi:hypothetical protein
MMIGAACSGLAACKADDPVATPVSSPARTTPFDADVAFLRQHGDVVVLTDPTGSSRVVVAPGYQGRVMTSTTGGSDAPSFGWLGRAAIESGNRQPHINVFGGEDRFWVGPEGGQYSLFFRGGDPFDLEHWQVPEPIDWGRWNVVSETASEVRLARRMSLVNYSGTPFDIDVDRVVRVLDSTEMLKQVRATSGSNVRVVAFESSNTVTNTGRAAWQSRSGLVSVWILGMFNPSPDTTIVIPFVAGPESERGPIVNDKYFGKVPPDRLAIKDAALFFKGDGQFRSKIGLSPQRATPLAGSYDAANRVLTLVQYTKPEGQLSYVNSMWETQREPFKGDVINSYNDGPPEPGKPPLGPFYELETSSPALSLKPGERYTHMHRTVHIIGPETELDRIARAALNVGLADIRNAFR